MSNMLNFEVYTNQNRPNENQMNQAAQVYAAGFSQPPYSEQFSSDEAVAALDYIFDKDGQVVLASENDEVVGLGGGYLRRDSSYYIEELVVAPKKQCQGIGRATLRTLLDAATVCQPASFELRTNKDNEKAINLYAGEGFTVSPQREIVPSKRTDGRVGLDERIYMRKELRETDSGTVLQRVAVMYPSGNTTAVVFDQLFGSNREELNTAVMDAWKEQFSEQTEIEQCCFVTKPKDERAVARVEMFGGEFCGNATRSVLELLTEDEENAEGYIEVSGAAELLYYAKDSGEVSVRMPTVKAGDIKSTAEGLLVDLGGIVQMVVTEPQLRAEQSPRALLTKLLEDNTYSLTEKSAVGVSYYDETTCEAQFAVWVRDVNTIFDETACGSGTTAIAVSRVLDPDTEGGLRVSRNRQSTEIAVIQPSGEAITAQARWSRKERFTKADAKVSISGRTDKLYDGRLQLA